MIKTWKKGIALALAAVLTACGGQNGEDLSEDVDEQAEQVNGGEDVTEEGFPVEVTDGTGETVLIEDRPERIVSLIPSNTEIAFALGLNDEIVGVTDYANYPEEASEKQSIGDMNFDLETLLSLEPDLVLAHASSAHNSEEALEQIEKADIDVLVVNEATSFDAAYDSMEMIGEATGTQQVAEDIIADMKETVTRIEEKASAEISEEDRQSVWMEVSPSPDIFTTGQNTFLHEMLDIIQAENVAADQEGWVPFTEEEAVALQPDVIVTTYGYYTEEAPKEMIKERDGWSEVPAVKNDHIYDIHQDTVTRPGPRLTEGLELLGEKIYPDVFTEE